ncbi:unnamed protein product [Didymodactylos carnosus]|uniref:Uncharacterized protein n=1 Tax=Didymodactylos carnosus TaxID=1234261 RepID=A0A814PKX9_9BILA|nr:unnamed protein product [Didymodactylos carnosus]CAF1231940.1 unnamed protein product [Didymodactylos carnosus]CAF3871953.1 unnamed protein product [Didymodactylos carnosus]CAF4040038.1 unnamed protein product [Didymodactylos carnosus]
MNFTRILLPTPNDGLIAVDWHTRPVQNQPVMLIIHGPVGGSHTPYIRWMTKYAYTRLHLCCVIMHARGCGNSRLASPKIFNGAYTGDINVTIKYIQTIIGQHTPLFAVGKLLSCIQKEKRLLFLLFQGYFYGAGTLTKYLGEQGEYSDLTATVSCSASYDYVLTANSLEKWFNMIIYNKSLTQTLMTYLKSHENQFQDMTHINLKSAYRSRTIREYDIATAVPLFGYKNVLDYYKEGSSAPWIQHIRAPMLILSATDDPICCIEGLPLKDVSNSDHVIAVLTKEGGHVGCLQAWWPRKYSWENKAIAEYVMSILKRIHYDEHFDQNNEDETLCADYAGNSIDITMDQHQF